MVWAQRLTKTWKILTPKSLFKSSKFSQHNAWSFFHCWLNKKDFRTGGQFALFLHNWEAEIYLIWTPREVQRENRILYLAANMWQSRKVNSWYICNLFIGLSLIQFKALEKATKPLHVKCEMELISHGNLLLMVCWQSESTVYWKKQT